MATCRGEAIASIHNICLLSAKGPLDVHTDNSISADKEISARNRHVPYLEHLGGEESPPPECVVLTVAVMCSLVQPYPHHQIPAEGRRSSWNSLSFHVSGADHAPRTVSGKNNFRAIRIRHYC
jgi:hypothetical protein